MSKNKKTKKQVLSERYQWSALWNAVLLLLIQHYIQPYFPDIGNFLVIVAIFMIIYALIAHFILKKIIEEVE